MIFFFLDHRFLFFYFGADFFFLTKIFAVWVYQFFNIFFLIFVLVKLRCCLKVNVWFNVCDLKQDKYVLILTCMVLEYEFNLNSVLAYFI